MQAAWQDALEALGIATDIELVVDRKETKTVQEREHTDR
jgi:hypothetical protein